jgi:hypothetical protein
MSPPSPVGTHQASPVPRDPTSLPGEQAPKANLHTIPLGRTVGRRGVDRRGIETGRIVFVTGRRHLCGLSPAWLSELLIHARKSQGRSVAEEGCLQG